MNVRRTKLDLVKLPPDYICGFVDGEGCFIISVSKHKTKRLGFDARLHFEIELRDDDEEIIRSIQETLGCGRIYRLDLERYGWNPHIELKISSIKDIREKVIPFFTKHPLRAKKKKSFELFVQAAEILYRKEHLTEEGLDKLRGIKIQMNRYSKKRDQAFARVRENRVPSGERSSVQ